jgi:ATP-dependent RNA helicase DeaD
MGIINDNTRTRNIEIGKIDLMKRFAFFEVDKKYEKEIVEGFQSAEFRGTRLSVEISNAKPEREGRDNSYGKRRSRGKGSNEGKSFGRDYGGGRRSRSSSSKRRR